VGPDVNLRTRIHSALVPKGSAQWIRSTQDGWTFDQLHWDLFYEADVSVSRTVAVKVWDL
jgi:hypothetical protein